MRMRACVRVMRVVTSRNGDNAEDDDVETVAETAVRACVWTALAE